LSDSRERESEREKAVKAMMIRALRDLKRAVIEASKRE